MRTHARIGPLLAAALLVAAPLAGLGAHAQSPPPAPASFYGDLQVDGEPAPSGVAVVAQVDGEQRGCLNTDREGAYGGSGGFDDKLVVDGADGDDGKEITFLVDGSEAAEQATWSAGEVRQLNLTVDELGDDPLCARTTVTEDEDQATTEVEAKNVQPDKEVAAEIPDTQVEDDAGAGVSHLNVTTTEAVEELSLEVTQTTEKPEDVAQPEIADDREPLTYVDVDPNVEDETIEEATFSFHVETDRLAEQDLDPSEVFLHHNDGTGWTTVDAVHPGTTNEGHLFEATSPGFSVFAIGGPTPDTDEDTDETTGSDDTTDDTDDTDDPGGGGGGAPTEEDDAAPRIQADVEALDDASFQLDADDVPANATVEAEIPDPETEVPVRVDQLSFVAANDLGDVELRLDHAEQLPDAGPAWIEPSPGDPIGVFEVTQAPASGDIASATFDYEVPADELEARGVNAEDLALYRHDGDAWERWSADLQDEGPDAAAYETQTTGFSVFALAPSPSAFIEITDRRLLDDTVQEGVEAEVLVTLENSGQVDGSRTVELAVDGEVVDEAQIDVPAGEQRSVRLGWTPSEPGEAELTVDDVTVANPVVAADEPLEPAETPDETGEAEEPSTAEESRPLWPWIAIAATAGLALAVTYVVLRENEY
jgi:PGF-pre-PGF domain-containing protein